MTTETFTLEPENYRLKDIVKYRHLSPSGNRALMPKDKLPKVKVNFCNIPVLKFVIAVDDLQDRQITMAF